MEKIIQALFNTESEAFKGMEALNQLEVSQDISLGESFILSKDKKGNTAICSAEDEAEGFSAIGGGIIGADRIIGRTSGLPGWYRSRNGCWCSR